MWLNNSSNTFYPAPWPTDSETCELLVQEVFGTSNLLLIISIIFDLGGGVVSAVYLYQYFRGIEVSHPIYSVVFSNVLLSTFLSIGTFVGVLMWYLGLVPCLIQMNIIYFNHIITLFMNIISWLTISMLRYYLLKKNDDEYLDLYKVTIIALISNWGIIIGIVIIRLMAHFMSIISLLPSQFKFTIALIILISYHFSFFLINFKMDLMLKEKLENEKSKNPEADGNNHIQREGTSSKQQREFSSSNKHKSTKSDLKTKRKRLLKEDRNTQQQNSCVTSSRSTTGSDQTLPEERFRPTKTKQIGFEDFKDYAGIYIGDHQNIDLSSSPDFPKKDKQSNDDNNGMTINLPNQVVLNDNPILPGNSTQNQYRETIIDARLRNGNRGKYSLESLSFEINRNRIETQTPKKSSKVRNETRKLNGTRNSVISHISGSKGLISKSESLSVEEPQQINNDLNSSKINELYKDSREHRSIMKAVMANSICVGFIFVLLLIVKIWGHTNQRHLFVYILMTVFLRIYRTFATLMASIYCFEVINSLFIQTISNMLDSMRNLVSR